MALADSTARKQAEEPAPLFRSAPHNIEAEQALLGAILVNNEAFYRVSDFLEPAHFCEPIHQKVYQLARDLIRAGAGHLKCGHSVGERVRYSQGDYYEIAGKARTGSSKIEIDCIE